MTESNPGPNRKTTLLFGALVLAQAAHSVEEYVGRLWETFPPARLVSGLVSANLERGFVEANIALVLFGVLCWLFPVRLGWRSASIVLGFWTVIEGINAIGHPAWSILQGGYTPGVATAPILGALVFLLVRHLFGRSTVVSLSSGRSLPRP